MATGTFFEVGPRRVFLLGFLGNPGFRVNSGPPSSIRERITVAYFTIRLFFTDLTPFDAPCDFNRFIDGLLRINEAAQLHDALVGFNPDLE